VRSLVGDLSAPPRSGAGGRRRGRQAGPEAGSEERSGADGSPRANHSGSLCGKEGGHSLPGASRVRKALRKPWVSAEKGASETNGLRPGKRPLPFTKSNETG
jgi:hypothetical protein